MFFLCAIWAHLDPTSCVYVDRTEHSTHWDNLIYFQCCSSSPAMQCGTFVYIITIGFLSALLPDALADIAV